MYNRSETVGVDSLNAWAQTLRAVSGTSLNPQPSNLNPQPSTQSEDTLLREREEAEAQHKEVRGKG
jgi:hypothetical protein